MAGEINVTVVGTMVGPAELRLTPSGAAVANFTVASNSRYFDKQSNEWKDHEPTFLRCNIWKTAAENLVESTDKGTRLVVTGRLKQRSFEDRDGNKRTVMELDVDEVGVSLKWATAKVNKASRSSGSDGSAALDDPWSTAPAGAGSSSDDLDEPPF